MTEIWKDILGYEGKYRVSNFGRVYSLLSNTLLKPSENRGGYLTIRLSNPKKTFLIHRLVGNMFLENPKKLPCINHKDENIKNNKCSNLEWCSYKYNNNYGNHNKKISESKRGKTAWNKGLTKETDCRITYGRSGNKHHNYGKPSIWRKPIYCIELDTVFDSITQAAEFVKRERSAIRNVCNGKQKSCGKYHWKWA